VLRNRRHTHPACRRRVGLNRTDYLIVAWIVVGVLLVPLLFFQRDPGHRGRLPCESAMHVVSTAFHYYANRHNGELPLIHETQLEDDADEDNALFEAGWVFELLPYLDQAALHDKLLGCTAPTNWDPDDPRSFAALSNTSIHGLTCPDSPRADEPGGLNYVVNVGYMTADIWDDPAQGQRHQVSGTYNWNNGPTDENSAEDEAVSRATGVILYDARGRGLHLDKITDGQSHTILLSENQNAGRWISGEPHEVGFAVRIGGTATQIPLAAESMQGLGANTPETALQLSPGGKAGVIDLGPSAINANPDPAARGIPRPSSVHSGCVNVFFCDGSGRTVSDRIDPSVYARLISSGGARRGQALDIDDF